MIKNKVDVEQLAKNVDICINEDRQKAEASLSAKDLYIKSNPGLLGSSNYINNPYHLLRSFLTNCKYEPLTEEFQKKVAVYVQLPDLNKDDQQMYQVEQEGSTTEVSENMQKLVKFKLPVVSSKIQPVNVSENTSSQDEVQMKSFQFSLPPVEMGPQEKGQSNDTNLIRSTHLGSKSCVDYDFSFPSLSKQTVMLNVEKNQDLDNLFENKGDTFELFLEKMYKSNTIAAFKSGCDVKSLLTMNGISGNDIKETIPRQEVKLILPEYTPEQYERSGLHNKHMGHEKTKQNGTISLKKKQKLKNKLTNMRANNNSEDGSMRHKSKRRKNLSSKTSTLGESLDAHCSPAGEEFLYLCATKPNVDIPMNVAVISEVAIKKQPSGVNSIASNSSSKGSQEDSCNSVNRKHAKTNIITLRLDSQDELQPQDQWPLPSFVGQPTIQQSSTSPRITLTDNTNMQEMIKCEQNMMRMHFRDPNTTTAKVAVHRYKELQVFSERSPQNLDDDLPDIVFGEPSSGYKAVTRTPIYKLDERDYTKLYEELLLQIQSD